LRNKYLPIEHDTKLTKEQKLPYMIEWWTKSLELTVATQINRDDISEIVRNSATHLKEGCQWFFYTLERYDVPLLIFSAGLGNIIQEWLLHQCGSFKNMKIISNYMSFDKQSNKINGFAGGLIHIFNKNEGVLIDTEYAKLIENRPNIILLGDSLGDVDMAAGVPTMNNIIKIGFLNEYNSSKKDLLAKFMDAYDIVTINDNSFNVPNAILRSII
jgi:HAD superfamily hydrolase (TIGR01544 family)